MVVPRTPASAAMAQAIAAHRQSLGDQLVRVAEVQAHLRQAAEASQGWKDAVAQQHKGLDAEQNLDLDGAAAAFAQARAGLEKLGAPWFDAALYGEVLVELARVRFEQGSADTALDALKSWAQLSLPDLDERSFPPPFVALSRQARSQVQPLADALPLEAFWASGQVDWVLEVQTAGPQGGATAFLLLYYKPSSPRPVASAPVVEGSTADQTDHLLQVTADALFTGPVAPLPAAPDAKANAVVVHNPNDTNAPITLFAGMAFPYWDNYSRYQVNSDGIGLDIGARFGFMGAELGGVISVMGEQFALYQFTPVVRWTWTKARLAFFVEPGLFLQIRDGQTNPLAGSATDVLFGVQGSAGIGLHLSDSLVLSETVTVGAILAGDFDLNAPTGFHTALSYTF